MAWQTPKTDWVTNPIKPRAQDFNRIEGNIAFLKQEIENKKGLLVDAINAKQQLVTIESSYQEMANAINIINRNPRMASGTAQFSLVEPITIPKDYYGQNLPARARQAQFSVSGLPFRPSRIFVRGRIYVRIRDSTFPDPPYSVENWVTYQFGIVNGVLTTPRVGGEYLWVAGGMGFWGISYAGLSVNISYQPDGFTVTVTATEPSDIRQLRPMDGSENIQYWFAYEQEG